MKKVKLNSELCDSRPFCPARVICPAGAIEYNKTGIFSGIISVNEEKCVGCGKCVSRCPHGALKL